MSLKTFNPESIISNLEYFNYRYEWIDESKDESKEEILKIYLPMYSYLKIKITERKVKFSSHIRFGFRFLPLEYNFIIYSLVLYWLASSWTAMTKGIYVLFAIFIIHFVVSFIKIESMKTIVHNWIENEN